MNEYEIKSIAKETAAGVINQLAKAVDKKPIFDGGGSTPSHNFKSMGDFFKSVVLADAPGGYLTDELRDYQKKTAGYMEEGDLSQGGFAVPTEFASFILEKSLETSVVRPRAYKQPMGSNRLEIPAEVDSDHSSNLFGGITIYRPGEGGSKTPTNPTFGKIGLQLHKLVGLCYVTDELLEEAAFAIEAYLRRKFPQAISFYEDDDFLNGDGSNKAIGALNAANPSLITVDAETGQGSATIVWENIVEMWQRMYPAGQDNAIWLANPECFRQLSTMSAASGTAGIPVWLPANSVSNVPYRTLMGRPLIFTEKCQALGTAGDIALCDFSQYVIGQKGDGAVQVASSIHIKFDYDQTAFRFVLRYDGQPMWLSTLTPKRGSNTLSPFIVLNSSRT